MAKGGGGMGQDDTHRTVDGLPNPFHVETMGIHLLVIFEGIILEVQEFVHLVSFFSASRATFRGRTRNGCHKGSTKRSCPVDSAVATENYHCRWFPFCLPLHTKVRTPHGLGDRWQLPDVDCPCQM